MIMLQTEIVRNSQGVTVNDNGCMLLDFCKFTGIKIANRRMCEDNIAGKVTCIKGAGCSLVDYVLCMPDMLPYFNTCLISDPCISSDHCHIQFSLYNNTQRTSVTEDIDTANTHTHTPVDYTYTWDERKTQQYLDSLHTDQITEAFTNLSHDIESIHSPTQINDNLHTFSNLLHDVCDPLFTKPCKK